MDRQKTTLVVMAAGMGSRYGGIKQLDPVGSHGETILEYGLYDAVRAGFDEVVFILRREIEANFHRLILDRIRLPVPVRLVFQDAADLPGGWTRGAASPPRTKPWGTAHAVWCARTVVDSPFAVINADDFYGLGSYQKLGAWLSACDPRGALYALVGYRLDKTLSDHGSVSRGICQVGPGNRLISIEEHTHLQRTAGGAIASLQGDPTMVSPQTTVSMNMFGLTPAVFPTLEGALKRFLAVHGDEAKAECYLPKVVGEALAQGEASVEVLDSDETWFGVTYQEDRPGVLARIQALVSQGLYPQPLWSAP